MVRAARTGDALYMRGTDPAHHVHVTHLGEPAFLGLAFLATCVVLREFALGIFPDAIRRILGEGLLIIGWVAMWGPLEVFLYGWWPISSTCRILERLANLDVEVRSRGAREVRGTGLGHPAPSG